MITFDDGSRDDAVRVRGCRKKRGNQFSAGVMMSRSILLIVVVTIGAFNVGCVDEDERIPAPVPDVDNPSEGDEAPERDEVPPFFNVSGEGPEAPVDEEPESPPMEESDIDDQCPRSRLEWAGVDELFAIEDRPAPRWPIDEDTQLCSIPWGDVIARSPGGDAWVVLAREYIAARLNLADGVRPAASLNRDLVEAEALLRTCEPMLSPPETSERRRALQLASDIAAFNEAICPSN